MRILFMGTPDWAVPTLEALVDSDYEVCAVLTQPDRPAGRKKRMQASAVKQWAIDHELMVHTPENAGSPQTLELLKNIEADLYLVCAYGQILPQSVLDLPKKGLFQSAFLKITQMAGCEPCAGCDSGR